MEQFGKSTRDHWGVENSLHWALDVVFREDGYGYQDRMGGSKLVFDQEDCLRSFDARHAREKGKSNKADESSRLSGLLGIIF